MNNTICWTTSGFYGDKNYQSIRITDTVITTVKAIGKGQITVKHVVWAINSQLTGADKDDQLTEAQVKRVLSQMVGARGWMTLKSNGHGVYRWN